MQEFTHTKIVCTIGPSTNDLEGILKLIECGMNVARINFSHGSHEEHRGTIARLKQAREIAKVPLAIMLDTKGPEIRVGQLAEGKIEFPAQHCATLVDQNEIGNLDRIPIHPSSIFSYLRVGDTILFDDGYISSQVISIDKGIQVKFQDPGLLKSRKGVNIPGVDVCLPALTDQDIEDIIFGCKHDVDIIAASFIRSSEHVMAIKRLLKAHGAVNTLVFAKIENSEGVNNFDSIINIADGIMVARGDLGVEVPLSQVPKLQKQMIRKCYLLGKPTVTATQMLESMIVNPRPTRAEVSDVANAIYDSSSMVMLSAETAAGKHPFKSVQVMKNIIKEAESDINYRERFFLRSSLQFQDIPSSITLAMVNTGFSSNAKVLITLTNSGRTARLASSLRPGIPIIAVTSNPKIFHQLAAFWGVMPLLTEKASDLEEAYRMICKELLKTRFVCFGDLVVLTAGSPFGITGTTNIMLVKSIGNVLLRGFEGFGEDVRGNLTMLLSNQEMELIETEQKIVILSECTPEYLPMLEKSRGIILQKTAYDTESVDCLLKFAKENHIPVLITGELASQILKEGQFVTLSSQHKIVYDGMIIDN